MLLYSFPLRPPCSCLLFFYLFFSWRCKSHSTRLPAGVSKCAPWTGRERKAPLVVLLMWQQGLHDFFLLQRHQQPSLQTTSNAAMVDPFLELLVIVFLGDPIWPGFPAAVCCLEPAVRLAHNKLVQTHSFPVEKKKENNLTSQNIL